MKSIKIDTNCNVTIVDVLGDVYISLREQLKGWPEKVRPRGLPHPYCMMVDEDGRLKELPFNPVGSELYGYSSHGSPIVGDIYLMIEKRVGEVSPLMDEDIQNLSFVIDLAHKLKEAAS
jgi:hypothetical protein